MLFRGKPERQLVQSRFEAGKLKKGLSLLNRRAGRSKGCRDKDIRQLKEAIGPAPMRKKSKNLPPDQRWPLDVSDAEDSWPSNLGCFFIRAINQVPSHVPPERDLDVMIGSNRFKGSFNYTWYM